jgi:hypothetical protein
VTPPRPIRLRLDDVVVRADRAALVAAVTDRVRGGSACTVVADVGGLTADGEALDALARLQLAVRRAGAVLVLERASAHLRSLLDLTGLAAVLPVADELAGGDRDDRAEPLPPERRSVEVVRQAELGEEPGPDEVRDAGDAAVAHLEQVDRPGLAAARDRAGLVLGEGG